MSIDKKARHLGPLKKTGEICGRDGHYKFDGYIDSPDEIPERPDQRETISMKRGDTFPVCGLSGRVCYWKFSG